MLFLVSIASVLTMFLVFGYMIYACGDTLGLTAARGPPKKKRRRKRNRRNRLRGPEENDDDQPPDQTYNCRPML